MADQSLPTAPPCAPPSDAPIAHGRIGLPPIPDGSLDAATGIGIAVAAGGLFWAAILYLI